MPDIIINGVNICQHLPENNCLIVDPTASADDPNAFQATGVAPPDSVGPPKVNDTGDGEPSSEETVIAATVSKIPPLDTHPNTVTQPDLPV